MVSTASRMLDTPPRLPHSTAARRKPTMKCILSCLAPLLVVASLSAAEPARVRGRQR